MYGPTSQSEESPQDAAQLLPSRKGALYQGQEIRRETQPLDGTGIYEGAVMVDKALLANLTELATRFRWLIEEAD